MQMSLKNRNGYPGYRLEEFGRKLLRRFLGEKKSWSVVSTYLKNISQMITPVHTD